MSRLIDADELIKQTEQTYCTGCNNYNKVKCRACPTGDMLDDLDNAPTVNEWHYPSKGEYPTGVERVLCCIWENEIETGFYSESDKGWYIEGYSFIDECNIVKAWMPLPLPPKENE